ncbi:Transducin family protein / WD-40 repeat family protein [Zea mays]|uniref:Transducin family protein / WD-40 repeat family protein n=5 Tax=Zea mays TaxID=4577 RepID=A0A1D6E1H2_MAIZE|nr:Transducin family protein / WD-40 repeat family protein [Zea mays]ONM14523.1 Transducin family protein / WD-40 repeat family protein [Zea mays]ONM14525.1 Transducin family protein / WD-40 repeat family protein [Zea mays]|eukprot:XP_008667189.1 transducin family protein / WD-40 repeat family protein isoform X1 [Zea mays]
MASSSTCVLKKNYRCDRSLQQFYTGGPFAVGLAPGGDGEGGAEAEAFLACACGGEVRVVSSADASAIGEPVDGDSEAITALALSPDSRLLFAAGHSRLIRAWDLASRACIRSWKGHDGPIMAMACHVSGGLLATAGADKKVCVWDVDGGFCTHFLRGHTGVVTSVMFHKDPKRLLLFSGSEDGTVRVWNLETKKCVAVLKEHFSAVTSLALSDDGQTLLSAGRDKIVTAWDIRKYSSKKTIPTYEMIEAVSFIGPGSEFLACLGIELANKKEKDTAYFLTVGERGVVRIWCLESCLCVFEQQTSDVTVNSENKETRRGFTSAVMLPNEQGLLCVTADQQFLFYCPKRTDDGTFELSLYRRLIGYNDEILDLKFIGEEEQYLAVATNLEQVRVYDVASMSCSYVLAGHTEIIVCIDTCVSASGKTLVVTGSKDNTVRLWDAERKSCIGIGKGHLGAVGSVAFSKKTKDFFVSGSSDRTIKVWTWDNTLGDAEDEVPLKAKAVVAAHDKDINYLTVSPNDGLVCSGSEDRTACIWKLPNLVFSVALKGHKRGIWSVEFSPVEQCVMTSSGDRTIKIWSVADGSCLKTFEGHTSSVLRASFLSRGTQVVSCGSDGLVKLWTIKTNECIATYDKHDGKVWALAVGRKTEMVATGGTDAVLNLWHDCTMEDKQEDFRKKEQEVLRGQELENAVSDSDYAKAIQLAFELRRPHKLLDLFSQLARRADAEDPIEKALLGLPKDGLRVLLEYAREWNTKPKFCHVAQFVLFRVLRSFSPTDILEIKGISELLEGLIPYSQRHFSRVDRLVRSTFLLDYTLTRMSVVDPDVDAGSIKDEMNGSSVENGELAEPRPASPVPEKSSKKRKSGKSSKKGKEKVMKLASSGLGKGVSVEA